MFSVVPSSLVGRVLDEENSRTGYGVRRGESPVVGRVLHLRYLSVVSPVVFVQVISVVLRRYGVMDIGF